MPTTTPNTRRPRKWVVAAIAGVILLAWVVTNYRKRGEQGVATDRELLREDVTRAFTDPRSPAAEEAAEFGGLVERLRATAAARDTEALAALYDFERMADEIAAAGHFRASGEMDSAAARRDVATWYRREVPERWVRTQVAATWGAPTVVRVRRSDDGREAVVFTRFAPTATHLAARHTWWVIRAADGWRIYDEGNAVIGARLSRDVVESQMFAATPQDIEVFNAAERVIAEAYKLTNDPKELDEQLVRLRGLRLSPKQQYHRAYLEAALRLARDDAPGALPFYDEALAVRPDAGTAMLLRSSALNDMGRHEDALVAARRFVDLFGEDGTANVEEGRALEGLGRRAEAHAAYRAGLAIDPTNERLRGAVARTRSKN